MQLADSLRPVWDELSAGMQFKKCWQCGCMREALVEIGDTLATCEPPLNGEFRAQLGVWQQQLQPEKYACLGCAHCYPAVATNHFDAAYPDARGGPTLGCASECGCSATSPARSWPVVPGEYHHFCDGDGCPSAVSTLASAALADQLAALRPPALCIVGKTETENIGIDKIIKNTVANPTIKYLVVAGPDPQGHLPGQTLVALAQNGVDARMRVIGAPGKRPILRNVSRAEVDAFRAQVEVIDRIGCEDADTLIGTVIELGEQVPQAESCCSSSCGFEATSPDASALTSPAPFVVAHNPTHIELDKAGYFVILPQLTDHTLLVEHYAYDNTLLRVIQGTNARQLYLTIIENGWVSQLSHAAYLGKELARAELSLVHGFPYVQDGA